MYPPQGLHGPSSATSQIDTLACSTVTAELARSPCPRCEASCICGHIVLQHLMSNVAIHRHDFHCHAHCHPQPTRMRSKPSAAFASASAALACNTVSQPRSPLNTRRARDPVQHRNDENDAIFPRPTIMCSAEALYKRQDYKRFNYTHRNATQATPRQELLNLTAQFHQITCTKV